MPDKEPPLFPNGRGPHVVFDQVGIDLEPAIPQIADQGRVFVEQIADGFAQGALGQDARVSPKGLGPPFHGQPDGGGFQNAGMNSFNHWAFGAVGEWMWRHVAGLNPDDAQPGWKHFTVAPRPGGGVTWAKAEYESIRGRIAADWRIEAGKFTLRVTVPPNTSATIHVPTTDPSQVTEGGKAVPPTRTTSDTAVFTVGSGRYEFVAPFRP